MINGILNNDLLPEDLEMINETQNSTDLDTDKDYFSSCDKNTV